MGVNVLKSAFLKIEVFLVRYELFYHVTDVQLYSAAQCVIVALPNPEILSARVNPWCRWSGGCCRFRRESVSGRHEDDAESGHLPQDDDDGRDAHHLPEREGRERGQGAAEGKPEVKGKPQVKVRSTCSIMLSIAHSKREVNTVGDLIVLISCLS